ncbi:DNA replication/repair protein RecF [Candidatus Babeliales bacterium]|nr:DNA replication/repair protein RecF [Candidatus Babeliales bacterium]
MIIKSIRLNNFRCFEETEFDFDDKFIVVEGDNGSGKTSLLEAIYYSCYLRSFRTRLNRELISFDQKHFFIKNIFEDSTGILNQIQVGYSLQDGKLVRFNKKLIQSYKKIISFYKVICVTEDDLFLINGAPDFRRSFLNQSLFLSDFDFVTNLKRYRQILEQRNSFLLKISCRKLDENLKKELYSWTKQLWEHSLILQKSRVYFLKNLEKNVNKLLKEYFFEDVFIKLEYVAKNIKFNEDFKQFWNRYNKNLFEKEIKWFRSLFGFHLDDFSISFKKKKAKFFASRGQQKLILFLLKVSQLFNLQSYGELGCLLLDDFLTDFDETVLNNSLNLLRELNCQVFLTCPNKLKILSNWSRIYLS